MTSWLVPHEREVCQSSEASVGITRMGINQWRTWHTRCFLSKCTLNNTINKYISLEVRTYENYYLFLAFKIPYFITKGETWSELRIKFLKKLKVAHILDNSNGCMLPKWSVSPFPHADTGTNVWFWPTIKVRMCHRRRAAMSHFTPALHSRKSRLSYILDKKQYYAAQICFEVVCDRT